MFLKFAYRIGVITPYKQQLRELKNRFERQYGREILNVIDFNTVVSDFIATINHQIKKFSKFDFSVTGWFSRTRERYNYLFLRTSWEW